MHGVGFVKQFRRTIHNGERVYWRAPCFARKQSDNFLSHTFKPIV
jgi:hypothetical protein